MGRVAPGRVNGSLSALMTSGDEHSSLEIPVTNYLKFCVFALSSALVAWPVSGLAGLLGVVVGLYFLAGKSGHSSSGQQGWRRRRQSRCAAPHHTTRN